MAFGPPDASKPPAILCTTSDTGTVHVFRLPRDAAHEHTAGTGASSRGSDLAGSIIASFAPRMLDVYEAMRCSVAVKLPSKAKTVVAVLDGDDDGGNSGFDTEERYRIAVVDAVDGILYEYNVGGKSDGDWTASMKRELIIRRSGDPAGVVAAVRRREGGPSSGAHVADAVGLGARDGQD